MIDEQFKEIMQSNVGCAVIMAGSGSDDKRPKDRPDEPSHIEKIVKSLEEFGIPYEVRVCSAHKQPDELKPIIDEYSKVGGLVAYIAVAGGTDALSGTLSFHAVGPVISCPPDTRFADKKRYDNLFNESCLTNPPGSSNAYISRPENVGKLVAQMFAGINPDYAEKLRQLAEAKMESLREDDQKIRAKYAKRQGRGGE